jgi:hypothetical protein
MIVHFPELTLAELLDDPLVQLLMKSDGVKDAALRSLVQEIRLAARSLGGAGGVQVPGDPNLPLAARAPNDG